MIDVKNIRLAVSKIKNDGADKFLKMNGTLAPSNIDGVFHYTSLLPAFDKFILFELSNGNEISLILSNENITLADFFNNFSLQIAGYNFREDMSRINIDGVGYIMVDGNVELRNGVILSTDARGNTKPSEEIEVNTIIVEEE